MVCAHCDLPLFNQVALIREKFDTWTQVAWSYELEVMGFDSVWCYSATNQHDSRFDVVRAGKAASHGVTVRGTPTAEFSWFPGFSWSMASCRGCKTHLGWGFSPDRPHAPGASAAAVPPATAPDVAAMAASVAAAAGPALGTAPPVSAIAGTGLSAREPPKAGSEGDARTAEAGVVFFGLVLTKMRERDLTQEEVDRRLSDLERSRMQQRAEIAGILQMLGQLARAGEPLQTLPGGGAGGLASGEGGGAEDLLERVFGAVAEFEEHIALGTASDAVAAAAPGPRPPAPREPPPGPQEAPEPSGTETP